MAKKGELSKTAVRSLANRTVVNHQTEHLCEACQEPIWSVDLFPVQTRYNGRKNMVFYHKEHYKLQ
jgi:hypothetical protein